MITAQSEIVIDSFAGGGGASTGIEMALRAMEASGVDVPSTDVTIAINHNGAALAMHEAIHPSTVHMEADIWTVDPMVTTKGRPVGLLWASPDCRHFSSAKGGAPVSDSVRGLAWSIGHWAEMVQPRMIFLENVPEFLTWGPLIVGPKGHLVPDAEKAGSHFKEWIKRFKALGYRVDWKILRACDYGTPTIRKRFYIIMRRDGQKIVWPAPTHGDPKSEAVQSGKLLPWRTAADIIDWDRPCPSILMTKDEAAEFKAETGIKVVRPLADNTMARIAAGMKRYVLENANPFIVTCNHSGHGFRGQGLDDPFSTVTGARDAHGLVSPYLVSYYGPREDGVADRAGAINAPLSTVTTLPRHGLIMPILAQVNNDSRRIGGVNPGRRVDEPLATITGAGAQAMPVTATVVLPPLTEDQMAGALKVAAFLRAHGAWDDREFVTVGDYVIVDIGMRMLTPRELARAQGFPEDYQLAVPYKGGKLSESDQRHKIGNSVCPPVAAALVGANYRPEVRIHAGNDQGWLFAPSEEVAA